MHNLILPPTLLTSSFTGCIYPGRLYQWSPLLTAHGMWPRCSAMRYTTNDNWQTRSGREFSLFAPPETFSTGQSFLRDLRAALDLDDAAIDDPGVNIVGAGLNSPPGSPRVPPAQPSSPLTPTGSDGPSHSMGAPSSSIALPAFSTAPPAPSPPLRPDIALPAPPTVKPKRKRPVDDDTRAAKKERRQVKRKLAAEKPTTLRVPTFRDQPAPLITELPSLATMPVTSTGFTAQRLGSLKEGELWSLDELKRDGKRVYEWDGWYEPNPTSVMSCHSRTARTARAARQWPSSMTKTALLRYCSVGPPEKLARSTTGLKLSPASRLLSTSWGTRRRLTVSIAVVPSRRRTSASRTAAVRRCASHYLVMCRFVY